MTYTQARQLARVRDREDCESKRGAEGRVARRTPTVGVVLLVSTSLAFMSESASYALSTFCRCCPASLPVDMSRHINLNIQQT